MPDVIRVSCIFGCSRTADDSLEHYCQCPKLDDALKQYYRRGGGAPIDEFFGVTKGMDDESRVLRARVLHVKLRMMHHAKKSGHEQDFNFLADVEWNKLA